MASLNDLAKRCDKIPKEIRIAASIAAIVASKKILENLWRDTPVDTTKAVSNWWASIGVHGYAERNAYVPGHFGYTKTASVSAARIVAFAMLDKKKPGESVFIVNNVDYILNLNKGSSKQAPAGFIEGCIFAAKYSMQSYKLKFKV